MKVSNLMCMICLALMLGQTANVLAASAKEQLESSPRHGEWVKISSTKGRSVNAFIVFPEIKEKATSVIVIHEIFGLTDWIRLVGDKLAGGRFCRYLPRPAFRHGRRRHGEFRVRRRCPQGDSESRFRSSHSRPQGGGEIPSRPALDNGQGRRQWVLLGRWANVSVRGERRYDRWCVCLLWSLASRRSHP